MNNSEEDLENLECLDLNEIIEEKNKSQKISENKKQTQNSNTEEENLDSINLTEEDEENPLFKLTKSLNKDIKNYLKESEEANLILTNNFTLNKKSINHTTNIQNNSSLNKSEEKERESITDLLKSTIKKSKHSETSSSLYDTLKIDEIKKEYEESQKTQNSNTSSIISNFDGGLTIGTTIFDGSVKIAKLLGEGAQAKVYLGIAEDNDEEEGENSEELIMAIKHFSFDIGKEKDDKMNKEIDALVNKCQTLKELSHDNIIQYFDCESDFNENSNNYMVNIAMEYQETNLTEFIHYYNQKNNLNFLPKKIISEITKKILEGIKIFTRK